MAKLIQNIPKAIISFHTMYCVKTDGIYYSGYRLLAGSSIGILLCQFTTLVESFMSTGFMLANGIFSCAWQQRNCYLNNILGWNTIIPRMAGISFIGAVVKGLHAVFISWPRQSFWNPYGKKYPHISMPFRLQSAFRRCLSCNSRKSHIFIILSF